MLSNLDNTLQGSNAFASLASGTDVPDHRPVSAVDLGVGHSSIATGCHFESNHLILLCVALSFLPFAMPKASRTRKATEPAISSRSRKRPRTAIATSSASSATSTASSGGLESREEYPDYINVRYTSSLTLLVGLNTIFSMRRLTQPSPSPSTRSRVLIQISQTSSSCSRI